MSLSSDTELKAPRRSRLARASGRLRRAGEDTVLWLHRRAERLDLIPPEFGQEAEIDAADARAVAREWVRQARLWAGYNPEQMLALKAGGVALGGALLVLVVLIGALG
jgi:hypothetical protein